MKKRFVEVGSMKKRITKVGSLLVAGSLAMAMMGCGAESEDVPGLQVESVSGESNAEADDNQAADVNSGNADQSSDSNSDTDTSSATSRKDGERFEGVIMLEGMEETVKYEHAVNETLGIEIDFEYESVARYSGPDRETFVSVYEDFDDPTNYLEVEYRAESSDEVVAAISQELSGVYDIATDTYQIADGYDCTRIDAINGANGGDFPDELKTIYVIPAGDGTVVCTAHFTIESAEGFGHRFDYMVNTLVIVSK